MFQMRLLSIALWQQQQIINEGQIWRKKLQFDLHLSWLFFWKVCVLCLFGFVGLLLFLCVCLRESAASSFLWSCSSCELCQGLIFIKWKVTLDICISKTTTAVDIFWLHSFLGFFFQSPEQSLYPQLCKTLLKRLYFIIILLEISVSSGFQNLFFSSFLPPQKCFFFSAYWNGTVTFH